MKKSCEETPARRAVLDEMLDYYVKYMKRRDCVSRLAYEETVASNAVKRAAKSLCLRLKERSGRWRP